VYVETTSNYFSMMSTSVDQDIKKATPNGGKMKQKKIGHRRVDANTGQTTYKKTSSSALSSCIQLGITHTAAQPDGIKRDILMQDFQVLETLEFPTQGSQTTPAHHNGDFTFTCHAPLAFRYFRDLFGIEQQDYLMSFSKAPLIELSNPGASGSLFFVTHDDAFIIKTVQAKEATFLQQLLPGYYMNIVQNPRTLLPKFYGLYTVNTGTTGRTIRVCVMNNLLPRKIKMHIKFDLKGSTKGRKASKNELKKSHPTYKDLDLINKYSDNIFVDPDIRKVLLSTLEADCLVLSSFKIMDYSLLLAIHNVDKCEQEAKETQESKKKTENCTDMTTTTSKQKGINVLSSTMLRNKYNADIDHWSGGIPARNKNGERLLIFCGIIDILQCYKLSKKLEHGFKSLFTDGDTISVHKPKFYFRRFLDFMVEKVFNEDQRDETRSVKPTKRGQGNHLRQSIAGSSHLKNKKKPLRSTTSNNASVETKENDQQAVKETSFSANSDNSTTSAEKQQVVETTFPASTEAHVEVSAKAQTKNQHKKEPNEEDASGDGRKPEESQQREVDADQVQLTSVTSQSVSCNSVTSLQSVATVKSHRVVLFESAV